jgi:hypothetical protein
VKRDHSACVTVQGRFLGYASSISNDENTALPSQVERIYDPASGWRIPESVGVYVDIEGKKQAEIDFYNKPVQPEYLRLLAEQPPEITFTDADEGVIEDTGPYDAWLKRLEDFTDPTRSKVPVQPPIASPSATSAALQESPSETAGRRSEAQVSPDPSQDADAIKPAPPTQQSPEETQGGSNPPPDPRLTDPASKLKQLADDLADRADRTPGAKILNCLRKACFRESSTHSGSRGRR